MDRLERFVTMLSHSLDTRRKRHLMGGILMSVSMLCGGLAITVMTIKSEENNCE